MTFRAFMAVAKALADDSRVRMLLALRDGELCVCQITELFGFAPSTVSKHLSILHQAGLVLSRKSQRWVYYRLPDKPIPAEVRDALSWAWQSVGKTDEAAADAKELRRILKTDPEVLCRRRKC
jgi:DNA-binding transcriptional ArsR family regulator